MELEQQEKEPRRKRQPEGVSQRASVAAEFARAEAEHAAAVATMEALANKRMALLLQLKTLDAEGTEA